MKTLRLAALLSLFTIHASHSSAQSANNLQFSPLFGNYAGLSTPSKYSNDFARWHISYGLGVYGGSNGFPFSKIFQLYNTDTFTNATVDEFISQLQKQNSITIGMDIPVFLFEKNFGTFDDACGSIRAFVRDRACGDLFFSDDLLKLAWKGNAQFVGQNVNVGLVGINSLYYREYGVGGSFKIPIASSDEKKILIGANVKWLQGIAFTEMPKTDAFIYTDPEGKYIDITLDQQMFYSGLILDSSGAPVQVPKYNNQIGKMNVNGKGIGFDASITYQLNENFGVSASLYDAGKINFTKKVYESELNTQLHFEGVEVSDILNDLVVDSIGYFYKHLHYNSASQNSYIEKTPSRFCLSGTYQVIDNNNNGDDYAKEIVQVQFVNCIQKRVHAVEGNYFNLVYSHFFESGFNLGTELTIGGIEKLGLGVFTGARIRKCRIGAGCSNLFPIIRKNSATGTSFQTMMSFDF